MKFVKWIDDSHIAGCPKQGMSHGRLHGNLQKYYAKNEDLAAEDGYYALVTQPKPDGYYVPRYTLDGIKVYQSWVAAEPQTDVPSLDETVAELSDRLDVAEGAILELADEVYKEA